MNEKQQLSVLIADDHAIVKFGLSLMLREMYVNPRCFEAGTYDEVHDLLRQHHIDLLILDISMPGGDNMKSVEGLKMAYPKLKILVFSFHPHNLYAERYLKTGADGFLNKDTPESKIRKVISAIICGEQVFKPAPAYAKAPSHPMEILSDRELDVAKLLSLGMGNLEIANTLNLQMSTVSTYKKRIFEKLKIRNIPELIQKQAQ